MPNKNPPQKQNKTASARLLVWLILGVVLLLAAAVIVIPQLLNNNPAAEVADALPLEVSVDEAKELQDAGAFILDVREPDEWISGHISGAVLIPLGELPDRIKEVPSDQKIVVVCRSGNRSAQGRDVLINAGYTRVTSMNGGVNTWSAKGYPLVTGP